MASTETQTGNPSPQRQLPTAGDSWPTPQVVQFLGISRQAVSKRLHSKKLLGAPARGVTYFPAWQFDHVTRDVRPELAELVAAFDEQVDSGTIAMWSLTPIESIGLAPGSMLISPETKHTALELARSFEPGSLTDVEFLAGGGQHGRAPGHGVSEGPQQAILAAAAKLFALKGPAKVSLREVATEAGVTYGLIHRFYGTKENLLVAVMRSLVEEGGNLLSGEDDIYTALDHSFGADYDSGRFGRMLGWAVLEGTPPDHLFGEARSRGYRSQIEALWENPAVPDVRETFDSNVLASLLALVGSSWGTYEPYLAELAKRPGYPDRSAAEIRQEVTDMLKTLVYATRPDR